jgi:hypothetical protein
MSLLVARGIRELELGVQKSQGNENKMAYNREPKNENCIQLLVGDSHRKLFEEELEVNL